MTRGRRVKRRRPRGRGGEQEQPNYDRVFARLEARMEEHRLPVSDAFRETFLCCFSPKVAAVFRQFVDAMEELALDRASYEEEAPAVSFTLAEMRAAVADVRHCASFLEGVASERRLSELTDTEQNLSALAEVFGSRLRDLAAEVERGIERLIADEPAGHAG